MGTNGARKWLRIVSSLELLLSSVATKSCPNRPINAIDGVAGVPRKAFGDLSCAHKIVQNMPYKDLASDVVLSGVETIIRRKP